MKPFVTALFLLCFLQPAGAQITVYPSVKTPTSFAIVIDSLSYANCREEVDRYRKAVEADRLGTYILSASWQSPEQVRSWLKKLAADKKSPLEGAVLIGDIPIVLLRDAQHLSSAFKMDPSRDWSQSSIPSDRFYDCFSLSCRFLKRDSLQPLYHYYSLEAESAQILKTDIYTARIKPLQREGQDPDQALRDYLKKAAEAHTAPEPLDQMYIFCGHGYNSESYDAWSGEQVALREQMPFMYTPGHRVRVSTFADRFPAKAYLLEHLETPGLDIALLHHHGAEDTQYLNGEQKVSDPFRSVENIKRYLRGKVAKPATREQRTAELSTSLGVPPEWFSLSDSLRTVDSVYAYALDLHLADIYKAKPQARFVMLDACYNGSFYEKEYIGGAYLFGEGKTLCVMANSVNSLQDKWPNRYLGLLGAGLRIGGWARHTLYLESHLLGDPTLAFSAPVPCRKDLNAALVTAGDNAAHWLRIWRKAQDWPDMQCMALRQLSFTGYAPLENFLATCFQTSPYGVVRLEALSLLAERHSPLLASLLPAAIDDSFELLRRMAATWVGECGNLSLIPAQIQLLSREKLSARVFYHALDGNLLFEPAAMKKAIREAGLDTAYLVQIDRRDTGIREDWAGVSDSGISLRRRMNQVRYYRNYHHHFMVPALLRAAKDNALDPELRTAVVEALGWFGLSYQLPLIVSCCRELSQDKTAPLTVRNEAVKTLKRLER